MTIGLFLCNFGSATTLIFYSVHWHICLVFYFISSFNDINAVGDYVSFMLDTVTPTIGMTASKTTLKTVAYTILGTAVATKLFNWILPGIQEIEGFLHVMPIL